MNLSWRSIRDNMTFEKQTYTHTLFKKWKFSSYHLQQQFRTKERKKMIIRGNRPSKRLLSLSMLRKSCSSIYHTIMTIIFYRIKSKIFRECLNWYSFLFHLHLKFNSSLIINCKLISLKNVIEKILKRINIFISYKLLKLFLICLNFQLCAIQGV